MRNCTSCEVCEKMQVIDKISEMPLPPVTQSAAIALVLLHKRQINP